jgi:small-conductance mechanosensitive channel
MTDFLHELLRQLESERVRVALRALAIVVAGFAVARLVNRRLRARPAFAQEQLVLRRAITGLIMGLAVAWALAELGLNLDVVLGAAGVVTVALGFAAQTSVSNLISGLFLMAEQPFRVGDVVRIAPDLQGEVLAIDMLSVKLRTFDNLLVRIPNETLIKTNIVNVTAFPIRRYDLQVGVAYKENIARVREVLYDVARANPLCLEEPKPMLIFQGYGDSALLLQFSVWGARDEFLALRNSISEEIKLAFNAAGIEIPFPHRALYAGSETAPLPVRLVDEAETSKGTPRR